MVFSVGQVTTPKANEMRAPEGARERKSKFSSNRQLANDFEALPWSIADGAMLLLFLGF